MRLTPAVLLLTIFLAGCSSWWSRGADEPTIGSLESLAEPVVPGKAPPVDPQQVMAEYRALLQATDDPSLSREATRRLADLELDQGEVRQAEMPAAKVSSAAAPAEQSFAAAIQLYQNLLQADPNFGDRDRILYQLARAYEAKGQSEEAQQTLDQLVASHPDSSYSQEAQFRRGEWFFIKRDYPQAAQAYTTAVNGGMDSPFHDRALFKLGWTQFKRQQLDAAVDTFITLLDQRLSAPEQLDRPDLDPAGREMLRDTFNVLSMSFAQLGGAPSVTGYFQTKGRRTFEYLVYRHLGDFYRKQERIRDAAETYLAFVELDPRHPHAADLQLQVIETYRKGGFPSMALAATQDLVERYRIKGPHWPHLDEATQARLKPHLRRHLRDLAGHYHAAAQQTPKKQKAQRQAAINQAIHWYGRYLDSFPGEPETGGINFLLAELLFEEARYAEAVLEYERTAYSYPAHDQSAEAGYAAILSYKNQKALLKSAQLASWQQQGIQSAQKFAAAFPQDKRASTVLAQAAEQLFQLRDYPAAKAAALQSLQLPAQAKPEVARSAWTVAAHSGFELGEFAAAEQAYGKVLQLLPQGDKAREPLRERLAAAIYQQGIEQRAQDQPAAAAGHFLRVAKRVPTASIRATAEFDAAASLISADDWAKAITVLEAFHKDYPQHQLQPEVTRKLAAAYLKTNQPLQAAGQLELIARGKGDLDLRRDAAWQAAELYQQAGKIDQAITAFTLYVTQFPQPLEPAMEARQHLVTLHDRPGRDSKRDYWLRQIVATERAAGQARTERTRFLAAKAALRLAEPHFLVFSQVRLQAPLKTSLKQKKQRMQQAIAAYGQAADYAIAEVTTQASYRIAEIYQQFGQALMTSARPQGLSAEELEQYELLLEEQAYPFEEKAIEVFEANIARVRHGVYDHWVRQSYSQLAKLRPARYAKQEQGEIAVNAIQ